MSFIWIGWSTWCSRPCPQILLFRKTPTTKFFYAAPPFPLRFHPSFFPKDPLNRSKNPNPVWRKSKIFRLQLTDDFGPFKVIIRTFDKLQSCSPLTFQHNLNHLDWTSEPKVMPNILTNVQAGILIRIGLRFGANFLWFLAPIGLKFNWVGIL